MPAYLNSMFTFKPSLAFYSFVVVKLENNLLLENLSHILKELSLLLRLTFTKDTSHIWFYHRKIFGLVHKA